MLESGGRGRSQKAESIGSSWRNIDVELLHVLTSIAAPHSCCKNSESGVSGCRLWSPAGAAATCWWWRAVGDGVLAEAPSAASV